MRPRFEIENIEEMRQREGIDDVELRDAIRELQVGDLVRLTLLPGVKASAGETLPVRITSIRGDLIRGKLVKQPASAGLSDLPAGAPIAFTTAHIHSLPRAQGTKGTSSESR